MDESHAEEQPRLTIRDRLIPILAVVAVVALLGLLVYAVFGDRSEPVESSGSLNVVGSLITYDEREAPDFSATSFSGEPVSLADFRGKTVVLNFWASWCPPCQEEAPVFSQLARDAANKDIVVIGVALWDQDADSQSFIQQYGLTYPNIPDHDGVIAVDYGVAGVPETFFIGPDGNLLGRYPGAVTSLEQVNDMLADLNRG